jgi:hypothetical protein
MMLGIDGTSIGDGGMMSVGQSSKSSQDGEVASPNSMDSKERPPDAAWDWKSSLGVPLTAISALFIILRVLSISAFETQTANAILQNVGTTEVILGTITAIVGPMIPVTMVAIVAFAGDKLLKLPRPILISVTAAALLMILFVSPVIFLIFTLIALPITILNIYGFIPIKPAFVRSTIIAVSALLLVAIALGTDSWLPSERLIFRGQAKPVIGYVLSTTSDSIVVLEDRPRQVEYFRLQDFESRYLCTLSASASSFLGNPLTLPDMLFGARRAHYPPCSGSGQ